MSRFDKFMAGKGPFVVLAVLLLFALQPKLGCSVKIDSQPALERQP
jgi:hypothetical protein